MKTVVKVTGLGGALRIVLVLLLYGASITARNVTGLTTQNRVDSYTYREATEAVYPRWAGGIDFEEGCRYVTLEVKESGVLEGWCTFRRISTKM